jgi:hypothetical protein
VSAGCVSGGGGVSRPTASGGWLATGEATPDELHATARRASSRVVEDIRPRTVQSRCLPEPRAAWGLGRRDRDAPIHQPAVPRPQAPAAPLFRQDVVVGVTGPQHMAALVISTRPSMVMRALPSPRCRSSSWPSGVATLSTVLQGNMPASYHPEASIGGAGRLRRRDHRRHHAHSQSSPGSAGAPARVDHRPPLSAAPRPCCGGWERLFGPHCAPLAACTKAGRTYNSVPPASAIVCSRASSLC